MDAGMCRYLQLVAAYKERGQGGDERATFAQWLAWRCSLRPRQAPEHERVADRLAELPVVEAGFARGELSYGKVSILTRVAEPASEQDLVELAEVLTISQLERAVGARLRRFDRRAARKERRCPFARAQAADGLARPPARAGRARPCCQFPGCDSRRFVEADHVKHWSQGGETKLENLVSLCRRHHIVVHERGYSVKLGDDGQIEFGNQYGIPIPNVPRAPPPSSPDALPDQHRLRGLRIDDDTCKNGNGDRMDLGLAVDALISICGAPG